MRSIRGPEMRARYFITDDWVQVQRPDGWPYQPHLHGFIAATSMKRLGKLTVPETRETVVGQGNFPRAGIASAAAHGCGGDCVVRRAERALGHNRRVPARQTRNGVDLRGLDHLFPGHVRQNARQTLG